VLHDLQFLSILRLQEEVQWTLRMMALSVYCYCPVMCPVAYVNRSEALLVSEGYHVIDTINVHVNRMTI
jgi:hypothetical protein